jgi:lipoic acid synthetase
MKTRNRLPDWLRKELPVSDEFHRVNAQIRALKLKTVCESARCPNISECYSKKAITLLILGNVCTRHCCYCAVSKGVPAPLDPDEPTRIAEFLTRLSISYVVITSVTRDDLSDHGSVKFSDTIMKIKETNPEIIAEVLIPDFNGKLDCTDRVLSSKPDIFGHNIEAVKEI